MAEFWQLGKAEELTENLTQEKLWNLSVRQQGL